MKRGQGGTFKTWFLTNIFIFGGKVEQIIGYGMTSLTKLRTHGFPKRVKNHPDKDYRRRNINTLHHFGNDKIKL